MNKLQTIFAVFSLLAGASAQQTALTPEHRLARDIFQQLIEINTTDTPAGNVTTAAEAMAARFRAAGFPAQDVQVIGPLPNKKNLVVRLHGRGHGKPILFLAHLDVVEALRQDWSMDPFKLNEVNGFFYGRGTSDIKQGDTVLVANFLRLKKEGWVPARDLILALTADEEGGQSNGVQWLLKNRRDLINAEFCINTDAGNFETKSGKRLLLGLQTSEKNYVDFRLEVKSKGGHSSRPVKGDNAIYHLAQGLTRLEAFEFPLSLNETTRSFFERSAALEPPATAADFRAVIGSDQAGAEAAARRLSASSPFYNAQLHTTCVATRLEGGHANNALPQTAAAIVNCRMLPQDSLDNVKSTLTRVLADDRISVSIVGEAIPAPASAINPSIVRVLEELSAKLYGNIPIVPVMDNGASDGKYLRIGGIPAYGVPGVFTDIDDDRAHGKDERIGVKDFYDGVDFYYDFLKALAQ